MPNFNQVNLMGNVTRDPELTYMPNGDAVADIGLAVNEFWTDASGEKKQETTFVNLKAYRRDAETLAKYVFKGDPLFVTGKFKNDTWEDKDTGKKMTKTRIIIRQFQFLKSAGDSHAPSETQQSRAPAARKQNPIEDDDIPY